MSIKRVQRLMKKASIRSITVKKFRPNQSKATVVERENILERNFSTTTINEKWVGDITYIHTLVMIGVTLLHDGFTYEKNVGYSFSRTMTSELITKALENAYHTQRPADGLIFHSDLGTQYTSDEFEQVIDRFNMTQTLAIRAALTTILVSNLFTPF